jgi:hypothetical protein
MPAGSVFRRQAQLSGIHGDGAAYRAFAQGGHNLASRSKRCILRLPPDLHRRLALEAAEARISLSRHLHLKLASA